jgi:hypothetical protein
VNVNLHIPAPAPGLLTNLLGVLSIAAIAVAVAFLTRWEWGVMTAGVFGVVIVVVAGIDARRVEALPDNVRAHRKAG